MGDMADYYREQADVYYDEFCSQDDSRLESAVAHRESCTGIPILRRNRKTRERFWGCSLFPACRYSATRAEGPTQGWNRSS